MVSEPIARLIRDAEERGFSMTTAADQEKKTRPTAGEKQPTADVPHGTDDTTQDAGKASQGGYCDRNG